MPAANAAMYVYELPDGSRLVTENPLSNRYYRLVRIGDAPKGIGQLAVAGNAQFFRAQTSAYDALIARVAAEHRLDFALVKAVMHVESSFNPYARSPKGAAGLMQVLPTTAARYGVRDVYNPQENVRAGVSHLRYLLQRFKHKRALALAAYNAGEYAVRRHGGIPPYPETQAYVHKVMQYERAYRRG